MNDPVNNPNGLVAKGQCFAIYQKIFFFYGGTDGTAFWMFNPSTFINFLR